MGFEFALEGRAGPEDGTLPKKSSPRSESPGLVGLEMVGMALLGCGIMLELSVVLGRVGGARLSSLNRSMAGAGRR